MTIATVIAKLRTEVDRSQLKSRAMKLIWPTIYIGLVIVASYALFGGWVPPTVFLVALAVPRITTVLDGLVDLLLAPWLSPATPRTKRGGRDKSSRATFLRRHHRNSMSTSRLHRLRLWPRPHHVDTRRSPAIRTKPPVRKGKKS